MLSKEEIQKIIKVLEEELRRRKRIKKATQFSVS